MGNRIRHHLLGPVLLVSLTLAGCGSNSDADRIAQLESKIEQMQSASGSGTATPMGLAGGPGQPVATPASAPAPAPVPAAQPAPGGTCNDGRNRNVSIANETGVDMREFYGSPTGVDDWEEDILGSRILGGQQSININFDDGRCQCVYDFKAVFTDGDILVREKIDVCTVGTYRYFAS